MNKQYNLHKTACEFLLEKLKSPVLDLDRTVTNTAFDIYLLSNCNVTLFWLFKREFPAKRDGSRKEDRESFTYLVRVSKILNMKNNCGP